ncbi:MAG TPA: cell surface protein SprA, partial [Flavobacterium sp.]|nr:cell surface protein SprA [Flavobacterium sp.]
MKDPKSIVNAYTYDTETGMYILSKTIGEFPANYPTILSPIEYEDRLRKESMRAYFKEKLDAIDGKKDTLETAKKNLLPQYYIKSGLFKSIFGSNTIDIKPSGSVDVDFGLRYTKQDNPAFPPNNRSLLNFDFNQRISMSLMGKVGTRVNVNINYDTQSTFSFQNLVKISFNPSAIIGEKNMELIEDVKKGINKAKDVVNKAKDVVNKVKDIKNGNIPKLGGKDDSIIKLIEVGNVNMPLNSSLIKGAQSLFGVKTQLQFGKTTITGVFSEQKSESKTVVAEGGGTVQEFDMFALDYDADRHFFLSQYFRNKYDSALNSYPFIDTRAQITRLEVWVTNKQNRVNTTTGNNLRNIIALQDLGEGQLTGLQDSEVVVLAPSAGMFNNPIDSPSDNKNNKYDPEKIDQAGSFLNNNIREITTSSSGFNGITVNEGADYSKLENARKLNTNEYTFHPQLGYISLQQRLANDEVLAVAYQYTIGDQVYQVGEFGNDGVDATVVTGTTPTDQTIITQSLILKMLKSNLTNVKNPVWNLMMKNIYQIPGAYQLTQDNFKFNILYSDPSPINYITPVAGSSFPPNPSLDNKVAETPLLKVFNLDKLNFNNDPQAGGDGFFDFMQGITIDPQNGRIIFTTKEPFGELLFEKLRTSPTEKYKGDPNSSLDFNPNQKKYVFRNMYASTQAGALQDSDKNKFLLRGKYKSTGGDGIPIGAFNVP